MAQNSDTTNPKEPKPAQQAGAKTVTKQAKTARGTETIRVQVPKGMPKSHISVLVGGELAEPVHGFVEFLRERAIVGLAIGFVVATQVQGVVKQLIASFLDPLSQLLFGAKLSSQEFVAHLGSHETKFLWGSFIYTLIQFFVVVITIYAIVKFFKLDKLDKPKK
ncbi:MAG TPA: MscL family protein [Candidatus Saccharimonadales bacterium]|nr:MscL family protein [Candidatus Saccharimonadales bacterium]